MTEVEILRQQVKDLQAELEKERKFKDAWIVSLQKIIADRNFEIEIYKTLYDGQKPAGSIGKPL